MFCFYNEAYLPVNIQTNKILYFFKTYSDKHELPLNKNYNYQVACNLGERDQCVCPQ